MDTERNSKSARMGTWTNKIEILMARDKRDGGVGTQLRCSLYPYVMLHALETFAIGMRIRGIKGACPQSGDPDMGLRR